MVGGGVVAGSFDADEVVGGVGRIDVGGRWSPGLMTPNIEEMK